MQGELFKAFEQESEIGDEILAIIERSVHRIGLKEFAFLLNISPNQIRDALNNNGKHFSVKWQAVILRRDPIGAQELINYLCDKSIPTLKHPDEAVQLSPEEILQHHNEVINRHGLQQLFKL